MPCKSSECFSVSYHPNIDEFTESKTSFVDNFKNYLKSPNKYILVPEKGKQNYYSHYQGWIGFDKEKRADTVRTSFNTVVMKNIEVSYLKTALKIVPITRDVKLCQGYCLKELELGSFDTVISNLAEEKLLECQKYYKEYKENKSVGMDKTRVNRSNIKPIFLKYWRLRFGPKFLVNIDRLQIIKVLAEMDDQGYWMGSLVTGRELSKIINYLHMSVNNKTLQYYIERDSENQDLDKNQLERARQP